MSFPGSIPSYTDPTAGQTLSAGNHTSLHVQNNADIIALATKLGIGASTPTAGTVLRGTGIGTSAYGQVALASEVSGVLPLTNGGTGGTSAATAAANLATEIGKLLFPIGCVYAETTGTNPSAGLGFGTWIAFGAGRMLMGNGTSDATYAAGVTGGESTHLLSVTEMPSHTHIQSAHNHVYSVRDTDDAGTDGLVRGTAAVSGTQLADTVAINQSTGGGTTHNNLPPYQVIYYWTRTA